MIWFVGAGCYHEDMITLAAIKVLEIADCILYDHLVNKELLNYNLDCELIDVGKIGHGSAFKQEDINNLLVEKSKQYKNVVRLKGGDPYIFGRGSEEMIYCLSHDVECQYIPGISALQGIGYAGVPLTHRGVSTGFSVHTLHYRDGIDHLDYDLICKDNNTHIFFMGASKIKDLVSNCLKHGKDPKTPIALVRKATYPDQQVLSSTLEDILNNDLSNYTNPLLIVLGDVVKMQNSLDNTKRLNSYGKKILLLSIDNNRWPIDTLLLEKGITAHQRKVADIVYSIEYQKDTNIDDYENIVFVSVHAVKGFIKYLLSNSKDIRCIYNKKIGCIGNKTADFINSIGLKVDYLADCSNRMNIILNNEKTLWVDGKETCEKNHLKVYDLRNIDFNIDDNYDAVGATCPVAIESIAKKGISKDVPLFVFAHKSYQKAKDLGFRSIIKCESSKNGMIEEIIKYLEKKE